MWELRGSLETANAVVALHNPAMDAVNELWLLTATALVLLMQAGFLMLEAGAVRSKNTINVAQKNITDVIVCGCVFLLIGGGVMMGAGSTGFVGFGGFDLSDHETRLQFLFQFAFCATAATIVSGAVAERMRYGGYVLLTVVMAGITYPVFAHTVWGNTLLPDNPAFLADFGFLDHAGSTVVHVVGGAAALAAVLAVGARNGRFDAAGKPITIRGHSSVLTNFGLMVLMIGWMGFNAGSVSPSDDMFSLIILNTIIAMSFGGAVGLIYSAVRTGGKSHPKQAMTSILGGLVAITAGCAFVGPYGAAVLGLTGGLVALVGADILLNKFKIDDPIDAIATHGVAGIWGTIAFPLFADPAALTGGVAGQMAIQTAGVALAIVWSFAVTATALKLISCFTSIRVSAQEEALGLNMAEHDDQFDVDEAINLLKQSQDEGKATNFEHAQTNLFNPDQDDQVRTLSLIIEQAKASNTSANAAKATIENLATRDQLTGLQNRSAFNALVGEKLKEARDQGTLSATLCLDIDGFKAINDAFGHAVGDEVLVEAANRLRHLCGSRAMLARFGGDEFIIHLPIGSANDWQEICDDIVMALSEKFCIDNKEMYVGTSIGVALFPDHGDTLNTLQLRGDLALYQAKARGKGRWIAFEPQMEEQVRRRRALEIDMRAQMNSDAFHFVYQPQVSLTTGLINGFEALMRWNHPLLGPVSPGEFIPIAEETGLIVPLTERLLRDACAMATHWPAIDGKPCMLSINISPVHMQYSDILATLKTCLEQTGLPANALEIEVTEGSLIADKAETTALLQTIRDSGVAVAVDDFGTGYSSLAYLQEFPITRLKVDQSFIKDLESNADSRQIAKSIVDLGKSLNLNVIAEGVETQAQSDYLRSIHCDDIQGYLFSKPVQSSDVGPLIQTSLNQQPRRSA